MVISTSGSAAKHAQSRSGPTNSERPSRSATAALLAWFRASRRPLPWRTAWRDPYRVLVSEVMLQQTQVAAAVPYYLRWVERFPTLEALAAADEAEALALWSGLGYYGRARRLHAAARAVVASGSPGLPADLAGLRALPGIGPYTAGAVMALAHNQRAPAIDGNVIRVLSRVDALEEGGKAAGLRSVEAAWLRLAPRRAMRHYAEALMELGATVCSPTGPDCGRCPLKVVCLAGIRGNATAYPVPSKRPAVTAVAHACALVRGDDAVLLVRQTEAGLWQGMLEMPRAEVQAAEAPQDAAVRALLAVTGLRGDLIRAWPTVRHSVTRYRVTLHPFEFSLPDRWRASDALEAQWVRVSSLASAPLPAAQRRALVSAFGSAARGANAG
ncbi:MAG: NUDIX domain-containing protein [Armatimonadetes bacterium]|nr:NUDIX domain-containing protein [Armatimonadota bacterium]